MDGDFREIQCPTEFQTNHSKIKRDLVFKFLSSVGSGMIYKDFNMQISDPDDPLFLYDYNLSSTDFAQLKRSQNLLDDFDKFPTNVKILLDSCINSQEFQAIINESTSELVFQQKSKISILPHLRLILTPASDTRIKQYLSNETKLYKGKYLEAKNELNNINKYSQSKAQELQAEVDKLKQEMQSLIARSNQEKMQIKQEYETKIEEVRQSHKNIIMDHDNELKTKKQTLINKYNEDISELRNELQSKEAENKKLIDLLQSKEKELCTLNGKMETTIIHLKRTSETLSETEKSLHDYKAANMQMEQKIGRLTLDLQKSNNNQESAESLREQLQQKKDQIIELSDKIKEMEKAKEESDWIINKSKSHICKSKQILSQYEKSISDYKLRCEMAGQKIKELNEENKRVNNDYQILNKNYEDLSQSLSKMKKRYSQKKEEIINLKNDIYSSQKVIEMLKNQLNKNTAQIEDDTESDDEKDLLESFVDDSQLEQNSSDGSDPVVNSEPFCCSTISSFPSY